MVMAIVTLDKAWLFLCHMFRILVLLLCVPRENQPWPVALQGQGVELMSFRCPVYHWIQCLEVSVFGVGSRAKADMWDCWFQGVEVFGSRVKYGPDTPMLRRTHPPRNFRHALLLGGGGGVPKSGGLQSIWSVGFRR